MCASNLQVILYQMVYLKGGKLLMEMTISTFNLVLVEINYSLPIFFIPLRTTRDQLYELIKSSLHFDLAPKYCSSPCGPLHCTTTTTPDFVSSEYRDILYGDD